MKKLLAFALVLLSSSAVAAPTNEAQIRQLLDRWEKAFEAKDIKGVMALYAPGTVAYDIVPPLQVVGKAAYQKNYEDFFAMYDGPLEVEFRDVKIIAGKDVGVVIALERMSGTLKGGQKSDLWLRATSALQKNNGKWLIVHDHISVPVNFETGKAALDLKP